MAGSNHPSHQKDLARVKANDEDACGRGKVAEAERFVENIGDERFSRTRPTP